MAYGRSASQYDGCTNWWASPSSLGWRNAQSATCTTGRDRGCAPRDCDQSDATLGSRRHPGSSPWCASSAHWSSGSPTRSNRMALICSLSGTERQPWINARRCWTKVQCLLSHNSIPFPDCSVRNVPEYLLQRRHQTRSPTLGQSATTQTSAATPIRRWSDKCN